MNSGWILMKLQEDEFHNEILANTNMAVNYLILHRPHLMYKLLKVIPNTNTYVGCYTHCALFLFKALAFTIKNK